MLHHLHIKQIDLFAQGRLNGQNAAVVQAHLESCPECKQRHKECLANQQVTKDLREAMEGCETIALSDQKSDAGLKGIVPPDIPGYTVVEEAGHGGMGVVYKAKDMRLDRFVAIKTMVARLDSTDGRGLFQREARLAARLRQQNIVAIHGFWPNMEPPCLVMEWVGGISLTTACRHHNYTQKASMIEKLARAVDYAHNMGVVHRDIKPGNILVDRAGQPRILDFGLAKLRTLSPEQSSLSGQVKGTPKYMAPEQILSPSDVGPSVDIFALGLILHELLTGVSPPVPPGEARLESYAKRQIPLPREIDPDIPEPLQRICLKAVEPSALDRYPTAAHLADDLRRFGEGLPVRANPTRYTQILQDRVWHHVGELSTWHNENLITRREMDLMHDRYLRLLQADSLWVPDARQLRLGAILVQLGGWLAVISVILWPLFYWDDLTSGQRVASVLVPSLFVNTVALVLWKIFQRLTALIFTITGTILIATSLLVCMSELNLLEWRMDDRYEWLPSEHACNTQLLIGFMITAIYSGALLFRHRYTLLAGSLSFLLILNYAAILSIWGMKDWLESEEFATVAFLWLPFAVGTYVVARFLDRPKQPASDHLAVPFYAMAAAVFLVSLYGISHDAPGNWLGLSSETTSERPADMLNVTRNASFCLSGILFFVLAWVHDRGATRLRRLWGNMYYKLVPPFCIVPLDFIADEPIWNLGQLGNADLYFLEPILPLVCLTFIALGTALQLRWFIYYGLFHFAYSLLMLTERHFQDILALQRRLVMDYAVRRSVIDRI